MNKKYKIWIFAGESSGDMYGAKLAEELFDIYGDNVEISGMGADAMRRAGVDITVDSTELGVVGAIEILGQLFTFIKIFFNLVKKAVEERPDAVILIDYPGFNLRFAEKMYQNNIPVIWYVTPQVWAWGKKRIPKLAKYCSKMMVIFPFETEVYSKTDLDVTFVGHPLLEIIKENKDDSLKRDKNTVLLLPGSRKNEIVRLFIPMLEAARILHKKHPELKFAVSTPRKKILHKVKNLYENFSSKEGFENIPKIEFSSSETRKWQQKASAGIAASGTVTVECAISGLPLVVAYKLNPITFFMARCLITLFRGFFTMVNVIADKEVFEEYLQKEVKPEKLASAVERILPGGEKRDKVELEMKKVVEMISGGEKKPSRKAAENVADFLDSTS